MIFLAVVTAFVSISSLASILSKPRWALPGSFNDPLACIFFSGLFSIIQDNSLYSWSIKWPSFLFMYFLPDQSSFCFDLCITISTKDMLLFQVSTLTTNVYVRLKKTLEKKKICNLSNSNKRNRTQSKITQKVKWKISEKLNCLFKTYSSMESIFSVTYYYVKCLLLNKAYEVNT